MKNLNTYIESCKGKFNHARVTVYESFHNLTTSELFELAKSTKRSMTYEAKRISGDLDFVADYCKKSGIGERLIYSGRCSSTVNCYTGMFLEAICYNSRRNPSI